MFDCPYCHAPFVTYSSLLNHKRYDHPAQPWPKKPAHRPALVVDGEHIDGSLHSDGSGGGDGS